jgi:hypothetical protein
MNQNTLRMTYLPSNWNNATTYWVQFIEPRRWVPGTVLTIPSDVPPFRHFLMVEYFGAHTGSEMVLHSMPDAGVARAILDEVIGQKPVHVFWTPSTPLHGEQAIERIRSLIGARYHLTEANCEHVIRWAITGKWESKQVSATAGAVLLGGLAVLASL